MAVYYIKSNFGKLKEIDGVELILGDNAFNSIEEIVESLKPGDKIILLDGKNKLDPSTLPEGVDVYGSQYVEYDYDNYYGKPYKSASSLTVKNINYETPNSFLFFKDIRLDGSTADYIIGGERVVTDKKNANGTGKWGYVPKAAGKIELVNSTVNEVINYANIAVNNSDVGYISATNYKKEKSSTLVHDTLKGSVSGVHTYSAGYTVGGTATVSGNSTIGILGGFSKIVINSGAKLGYVYGGYQTQEKSTYTFKTNKDHISVVYNGTSIAKTTGTLTANNADFTIRRNEIAGRGIDSVSKLNLINCSTLHLANYGDSTYSIKKTYKFADTDELFANSSIDDITGSGFYIPADVEAVQYETQESSKASGSVSIKLDKNADASIRINEEFAGDMPAICGYDKVDISGNNEYDVYVYGDINTFNYSEKEAEDTEKGTGSWLDEYTAAGSVTLKDNVFVDGDIINYANVNIKNSSANDIIAWESPEGWEGEDDATTWAVVEDEKPVYAYYKEQESISADGSIKINEEYKALGAITLDDADAGNISGFAKVTLKNGSEVAGDIIGGLNKKYSASYSGSSDKFSTSLVIKSSNNLTADNSVIYGDVSGFGTVKLTNTTVGNVAGVIAVTKTDSNNKGYKYDEKIAGSFTFALNAKTAASDWYSIGQKGDEGPVGSAVKDFKTVNISGVVDLKKGIFVTAEVKGDICNADKLTLKNNVWVRGNISDCKNVNITIGQVDGNITFYTEDTKIKSSLTVNDTNIYGHIEGYTTVTLTDCNVFNGIYNVNSVTLNIADLENSSGVDTVQKLTITNDCEIGYYCGTDSNDTVTINKGALLELADTMDFGDGTKDTLTVNGTLVLNSAIDFNDIGLESLTGSGVIVADDTVYNATSMLTGSKVKFVNLGNTVAGFHGEKAEISDNTAKKAAEADWDYDEEQNCYELDGWLGKGTAIEDTCDWLEFEAWTDGTVEFYCLGEKDTLTVNGSKVDNFTFEITAGTDYEICITRKENGSVQYYATMQLS